MQAPPKPSNEIQRLEYLKKLRILDTPIEARFDRITRLVCKSLGVSMSSITLIDAERQWFKSTCGTDMAEQPRSTSFCGHAILSDAPLVIADTARDLRFHDNPFVMTAPHVRFYAGCPLRLAENIRVGTLCVFDTQPRDLSADELMILQDFAEMAQTELASIAVSRAHLDLINDHAETERHNLIDPLTRLWNPKAAAGLLAREMEIAGRDGTPLTIVRADICLTPDAAVVADQIMRRTAAALTALLRPYDLIARSNDTGFLILLHNCSPTDAHYALNRIQKSLYAEDIVTTQGPRPQRLRMGAASCFPARGTDSAPYLAAAEDALQHAIAKGHTPFFIKEA